MDERSTSTPLDTHGQTDTRPPVRPPRWHRRCGLTWEEHHAQQRRYENWAKRQRAKSRRRLQALVERDGLRCCDCGGTDNLTIDHVVALVDGGSADLDNLALRCRACNARKEGQRRRARSAR